jgi:hypothetical protein
VGNVLQRPPPAWPPDPRSNRGGPRGGTTGALASSAGHPFRTQTGRPDRCSLGQAGVSSSHRPPARQRWQRALKLFRPHGKAALGLQSRTPSRRSGASPQPVNQRRLRALPLGDHLGGVKHAAPLDPGANALCFAQSILPSRPAAGSRSLVCSSAWRPNTRLPHRSRAPVRVRSRPHR